MEDSVNSVVNVYMVKHVMGSREHVTALSVIEVNIVKKPVHKVRLDHNVT